MGAGDSRSGANCTIAYPPACVGREEEGHALVGIRSLFVTSPLKETPVEESLIQRLDVSRMGERGAGLEFPILSPSPLLSALVCVNEARPAKRHRADADGEGREDMMLTPFAVLPAAPPISRFTRWAVCSLLASSKGAMPPKTSSEHVQTSK